MLYNITHACGHTEEHQLYGARKIRESREEWLKTEPCTKCRNAARKAAYATESAQAAEAAQLSGLPALIGTPKQIAWAETIRCKALAEVDALIESQAPAPERLALITPIVDALRRQDNASWWIDHREDEPIELLKAVR